MFVFVMARANLPAKKYKKSNPTCLRLAFELNGDRTEYVDLAKALSIINRKFFRQGVYYYVNSVEVYNNESGVVDIHTVPDNWVTKNAWNRGFQLFQKMNAMVDPPISGVSRPKYHDFKVFMDRRHATTGSSLNPVLCDINGAVQPQGADDWDYSEFVSADSDGDLNGNQSALNQEADNFTVHIVGEHEGGTSNWDSVGLIKSYAESRRTVIGDQTLTGDQTANVIDITDPLLNIFDMSSEEQMNDIVENLTQDNIDPPYNQNIYIGEQNQNLYQVARIGTEVGVGRVGRAAGFCVPFGLVCIDPFDLSTKLRVVFNLAPGTYHGVYAERA